MRAWASIGIIGLCAWAAGCGDEKGTSCSVRESDASVVLTCDDGTSTTLPRGLADGGATGCSVSQGNNSATIQCADGTRVTVPTITAGVDGGTSGCVVSQGESGMITIRCADGSEATIPGSQLAPLDSLKVIGATTASCGTCHDSERARAHFAVMTVASDAGPIETCGTCHNETSIEPVSRAHARAELGAPGLKVQLLSASIDPSSRRPTVRLQLTDSAGSPITRDGVSLSFTIAKIPAVTNAVNGGQVAGPYTSYISRMAVQKSSASFPLADGGTARVAIQPAAESGTTGSFVAVGAAGQYDYTFSATNALPMDYDPATSHVIAVYATRTIAGVRYVGNAERFFVPNNAEATAIRREVVKNETCNGCHNPLAAHGGSRQDVQLCLTCHTQGAVDPESGHSIDFNVMIHKIHMGKRLPSVVEGKPYIIVGNSQSEHDWSHASFPQAIENCQSCHTATDSDRWVTNGVREACVACHEYIDRPAAQGGHPFAIQTNSTCGNQVCHAPGGNAPDSIESHVTAFNNTATRLFDIELVSIRVANADSAPVVRVRARTGTRATGAMTAVASVDSFSMLDVLINGPNTGFTLNGNNLVRFTKAQLTGLAAADVAGEFTFTLPKTLRELVGSIGDPESDSYTLSLRAQYDPTPGVAPDNDRVDMTRNPALAFGAGETIKGRTQVVQTEKCNRCHGDLTAHGGANLAKNTEQCIMCHTGTLDTRVRQGANKIAGPTTSLRLATLIHRIHGSSIAETPYKVFGFSATPPYPVIDMSELGFPGDVRDCTSCHAAGTYFLPLPDTDPATRTVSLDADGGVIGQ